MTELEFALVGLLILLGGGAILYAGLRTPPRKVEPGPDAD